MFHPLQYGIIAAVEHCKPHAMIVAEVGQWYQGLKT
jgi:hypothetical protein